MSVSTTALVNDLVPALNASATANLTAATVAQLYESFNRTLEDLAARGCFANYTEAETLTAGDAVLALPTRAVALFYVAAKLSGGVWAPLEHWSRAKLEAYDPDFADTSDASPPVAYVVDLEAGQVRIYSKCTSDVTLAEAYTERLATVVADASIEIPDIVDDLLFLAAIRDVRAANGEEAMPDSAAAAGELAALLAGALAAYWANQ